MPDIESSSFSATDSSNNGANPNGWGAGQLPSKLLDTGRATWGAIRRQFDRTSFTLTSAGTSSALTLTPSPAIASLVNGQMYGFIAGTEVAAGATLNVNSKGAKALKKVAGGALVAVAAGDFPAGAFVSVVYNLANDCYVIVSATGTIADPTVCQGRLAAASTTPPAVPVQSSQVSVTGATTIYFSPYVGNQIAVYNAAGWEVRTFSEMSIAVPSTTNTNYDVFYDYNSGTPQLALVAWTNATLRATALDVQDGILVLSGAPTKRYLGTIRTGASSGQVPMTPSKAFIWNFYNRIRWPLYVADNTDSWTYSTAAWQQANANTANKVEFVVGIADTSIEAQVIGAVGGSAASQVAAVGIGFDSVTVNAAFISTPVKTLAANNSAQATALFKRTGTSQGYHYLAWLEYGNGSGTQTWYGDNGTVQQSGFYGSVDC
jgi:hypothetical protein